MLGVERVMYTLSKGKIKVTGAFNSSYMIFGKSVDKHIDGELRPLPGLSPVAVFCHTHDGCSVVMND